jgi:hypothetical protein
MIGVDYGIESLRSPWFQSTCWGIFSMTCKGLLPNTETIVKNLNLTPMDLRRNATSEELFVMSVIDMAYKSHYILPDALFS